MPLTAPTYSVQISFTDPFDTPDWNDITQYVRKGSVKRGRQHELQRAVAGQCTLTLTNQNGGRFSTFNTTSPYLNLLTGADSFFYGLSTLTGSTWVAATNCAVALVATQGFDGYGAMSLTSTAGGDMTASTATGTAGYAVTAGEVYGFQAQFKTAVSARSASVGVGWYNAGGTIIGAVSYGTAVTDATTPYTKAVLTATAPAGATFAAVFVKVAATGAANEVHYVTRVMLSFADYYNVAASGWSPGGRGLVPARPVRVIATWSAVPYPIFYGFVDSWVPVYGAVLSDQVLNCSDGMTLLALAYMTTSAYSAQIVADGALGYWRLGEQSPASFADSSGNGHPMTLGGMNPPATVAPGTIGALTSDLNAAITIGASRNGSPAAVSTAASFASAGPAWSVECWFKWLLPNPPGGLTTILSLGTGASRLAIGASSAVAFVPPVYATFLAGGTSFRTTTPINDGSWHHLVGTITAGGAVVLYVDGVVAGSAAGGTPTSPQASAFLGPGTVTVEDTETFAIDEVAVYATALSASTVAAHYVLGTAGFLQQQSGQRINAVLTAVGVPASLQSPIGSGGQLATGISAVQAPSSTLATSTALGHIQTVENTEQGFFFIDTNGQYTYFDRHYSLQNAKATTSNGTFASDNNNAHFHFQIGSLVPADDALDLWNDTPVAAVANVGIGVTGALQDAPNVDSIKWFGHRTLQGYTSMLQTTDVEALALSQWLVAHYGLPLVRVRQITVDSTANAGANIPQMLGRDLYDRITVVWQPLDGTTSALTQDALIESISHTWTPDRWDTTWGLSTAETQQYFILNDAVFGKLDSNKLGF